MKAERSGRAGFGSALAITVTLAAAGFLLAMSVVVLLSHPDTRGLGVFAGRVNQQNQNAKTDVYLIAWVVILPLAVILAPRVADTIAAGPNAPALPVLAAALAGSLSAALIAVRLSGALPWGDGLKAVLAVDVLWGLAAAAVLVRAGSGGSWSTLARLSPAAGAAWTAAAVFVLGLLVCVTRASSMHVVPLTIGAIVAAVVLTLGQTPRPPTVRAPRGAFVAVEALVVIVLALAIPNLVVFHTSGALPNIYVPPGVIQNQQDYLLGSANQLLGGGALLVNVPVSQYGVGLIYLLYGWFHIVPIGYGTLGLLDSILTAAFYVAGYGVLRSAGIGRVLSAAALGVAVVALIYGMVYGVGALPETGPLRFGLPIALVLAEVVGTRWPRRSRWASGAALGVLGLSAIWAFEAFAYTAVTFAAVAAVRAWLRPAGRRRWLVREALAAIGACVLAHLLLAAGTVLSTGRLPDWGQYLTYLRSFLLGGEAGAISYGFSRWSPGLAVGAGALASAAVLVLLILRAPAVARRESPVLIGLAGTTAYTIALLSYTDNRSSTYLLDYVTFPLLLAGALWLGLLWSRREECPAAARRAATAVAVAVAALTISAAWPSIGRNFSQTALAHAYPGGGARAALHRLVHAPPIDPRAPEGVHLLDRYVPGRRALIVLPLEPDLGVEILMRAGRANSLFIGDPVDDSLVPTLWKANLTRAVGRLRPGQRLLIDADTLIVRAGLRAHPAVDPAAYPIDGGNQELEWLLKAIDARFAITPMHRGPDGLILARLGRR